MSKVTCPILCDLPCLPLTPAPAWNMAPPTLSKVVMILDPRFWIQGPRSMVSTWCIMSGRRVLVLHTRTCPCRRDHTRSELQTAKVVWQLVLRTTKPPRRQETADENNRLQIKSRQGSHRNDIPAVEISNDSSNTLADNLLCFKDKVHWMQIKLLRNYANSSGALVCPQIFFDPWCRLDVSCQAGVFWCCTPELVLVGVIIPVRSFKSPKRFGG